MENDKIDENGNNAQRQQPTPLKPDQRPDKAASEPNNPEMSANTADNKEDIRHAIKPETETKPKEEAQNSPENQDKPIPLRRNDAEMEDVPDIDIGKDTLLGRYHKLAQKEQAKNKFRNSDNVSTIIVIVYTVLMLVLGFLVYKDITKRLDTLENRVSGIEEALSEKKSKKIDEIEIYDIK